MHTHLPAAGLEKKPKRHGQICRRDLRIADALPTARHIRADSHAPEVGHTQAEDMQVVRALHRCLVSLDHILGSRKDSQRPLRPVVYWIILAGVFFQGVSRDDANRVSLRILSLTP